MLEYKRLDKLQYDSRPKPGLRFVPNMTYNDFPTVAATAENSDLMALSQQAKDLASLIMPGNPPEASFVNHAV